MVTQKGDFLQIDEPKQMKHYFPHMSLKYTILPVLLGLLLVKPVAAEIPSGPISLEQCIKIAIENNLNLRITSYQPRLAALNLQRAYGSYDPRLGIGISAGNRISKGRQNPLQFEIPKSETDSFDHNYSLNGTLPTNTRYNFSLRGNESTGFGASNDPFGSYGSSARITLTQPLLKGAWSGDSIRMNIKLQKIQNNSSTLGVIGQIMQTILNVEVAYYGLIASLENVKVAEETLALTEKNFNNQKKRAEVGTVAVSELPELEAELLSQKASLLSVRNTYADNINSLKRLLSDDFAKMRGINISPIGELNPVQTVFNRNDSWDKALKQRPDILQSQNSLESAEIDLKFSKNQLFPQLDLTATYGLTGNNNSVLAVREYGKPEPVTGKLGSELVQTFIDKDGNLNYEKVYRPGAPIGNSSIDQEATFSRAFRDIRNRDFPYYNFGLQLNIPIPNRSARAEYKASQLQNERAVLQHKELEQNILVSIDGLIRDAEYRFEQISVTRQARISSNLAYQNQTKRYNEGAINNYQLLQAQRDLTNRRYSEINAKVQYLIALARLAEAEGDSLKRNNIAVDYDSE